MQDQLDFSAFRILLPTERRPFTKSTSSVMRISTDSFYFNLITAAELNYPESVCLFISPDCDVVILKPGGDKDISLPFYDKEFYNDKNHNEIRITNSPIVKDVRATLGLEKRISYKVSGVRYPEEDIIVFNLLEATKTSRSKRPRTCVLSLPSVADMIRMYNPVKSLPSVSNQ
ncbi:hypothetical protein B5F10_02870 [Anaerotruncus colihominis]|uniref:Uncharacterized protein n=1 Tax=Anaerotruncus colihominis TaxID=169435 RepID=A0A1Y4N7Q9_9FIRM|nr:hypothetical protein [Anaerotruncus colihominis]OUP70563.1 hypothetical protein B5F11_03750 [Anaerotruncus colihominis]OUP76101.1 hypothetical protein B5F10_02870 [Anaerotruncus colihominis]